MQLFLDSKGLPKRVLRLARLVMIVVSNLFYMFWEVFYQREMFIKKQRHIIINKWEKVHFFVSRQ